MESHDRQPPQSEEEEAQLGMNVSDMKDLRRIVARQGATMQLAEFREYIKNLMRDPASKLRHHPWIIYLSAGPSFDDSGNALPLSEEDGSTLPTDVTRELKRKYVEFRAAFSPTSDETPHAEN